MRSTRTPETKRIRIKRKGVNFQACWQLPLIKDDSKAIKAPPLSTPYSVSNRPPEQPVHVPHTSTSTSDCQNPFSIGSGPSKGSNWKRELVDGSFGLTGEFSRSTRFLSCLVSFDLCSFSSLSSFSQSPAFRHSFARPQLDGARLFFRRPKLRSGCLKLAQQPSWSNHWHSFSTKSKTLQTLYTESSTKTIGFLGFCEDPRPGPQQTRNSSGHPIFATLRISANSLSRSPKLREAAKSINDDENDN